MALHPRDWRPPGAEPAEATPESAPPHPAARRSGTLGLAAGFVGSALGCGSAFYLFAALGATGMAMQGSCPSAATSPACAAWLDASAAGRLGMLLGLALFGTSVVGLFGAVRAFDGPPAGRVLLTIGAVGAAVLALGVVVIVTGPAASLARGLFTSTDPSGTSAGGGWLGTAIGFLLALTPALLFALATVWQRRAADREAVPDA